MGAVVAKAVGGSAKDAGRDPRTRQAFPAMWNAASGYLRTYQPGMVLNFRSRDSTQKLSKGDYTVKTIDHARKQLVLEDRKGRLRKFNPARLRPGADDSRLSLFERKSLSIIEGDKIRWTDNDHKRGLFNADQARIVAIDTKGVLVETSVGKELRLNRGDPMLKCMDLAYALNAHMAQGLTSDRGIAVMDSRERNLANRQTFLVTVTRLRDGLTLIADNAEKLGRAIKSNSGEKASALEVTQRLKAAAAKGLAFGNRSKARRCIDIEHGYFDQPVTHGCGRSAKHLLVDPEEAGKRAPVIVIQFARRSTLDELLNVGRVSSDHPRDRGISEPSLLDQAIELLSDMFHVSFLLAVSGEKEIS